MSEEQSFRDLLAELNKTRGTELIEELRGLNTSIYTLNRNFEDITELDDWFHNQGFEIQKMKHRGQLEEFQQEYLRRLHNYTSAVYSLIKHTQRINQNYGSKKFGERYTSELDERDLIQRGEFLRQLRHYIQKRKLPSIEATVVQQEDGVRYGIVVKKDEMMEWDEWNQAGREYLESVEAEIDIQLGVHTYHEKVNEFYQWYYEAIQDDCSADIEERAGLIEEIQDKRANLFDGLH